MSYKHYHRFLQLGASAGNKKISDLSDPVSDTDAATKRYVDISKGESPTGIINPSTGSEEEISFIILQMGIYMYMMEQNGLRC